MQQLRAASATERLLAPSGQGSAPRCHNLLDGLGEFPHG
jgi:hypothetical protein